MYANQQPATYTARHYAYDPQVNSANHHSSLPPSFLNNYQTSNERATLEQRPSMFA